MNSDISVIVKPTMSMRELCARTGATPRMVRHYEKAGILAPDRAANGYRVFTEEDVRLVEDARCLIDAGLSAAEAAELISTICGDAIVRPEELDAALTRIGHREDALAERIAHLNAAQRKLSQLRDHVRTLREAR